MTDQSYYESHNYSVALTLKLARDCFRHMLSKDKTMNLSASFIRCPLINSAVVWASIDRKLIGKKFKEVSDFCLFRRKGRSVLSSLLCIDGVAVALTLVSIKSKTTPMALALAALSSRLDNKPAILPGKSESALLSFRSPTCLHFMI